MRKASPFPHMKVLGYMKVLDWMDCIKAGFGLHESITSEDSPFLLRDSPAIYKKIAAQCF
jgi:hypothetical protein